MNNELKARIEQADAKLARAKETLLVVSTALNRDIERFGTYRRNVLKNTVGRFKKDLDVLGKKLKGGAYAIPEGIEMPDVAALSFQEINFTSDQKWRIADGVGKAALIGTNKVLEMMHRHVDGEWTRALIREMRERVPGVVLRTTMIVGHPGEGKKEFGELLDFVREARFGRLGAFTYSEEEGTYGAEHYKDTVSSKEKQRRLDELMTLQSEISLDFNRSRVGDEVKVIVDGFSDGVYVCRSEFESPEVDGEILIKYDSQAVGGAEPYSLVGEFLEVRITGADEYDLIGEIIRVL